MATICMPAAGGVPGAPGPPDWWDPPTATEPLNGRLDDPRWRGAGGTGMGSPASSGGDPFSFRALHHVAPGGATSLYLLWYVRADKSRDPGDRVIVGFKRPGGGAFAFVISPFVSAPPSTTAPFPVAPQRIDALTRTGTTWGPIVAGPPGSGVPNWMSNAGGTGTVWAWTTPGFDWAVAMRVPLHPGADLDATGMNLGTAFRFWFEVQVVAAAGSGGMTYFPRWPFTAAPFATNGPGDPDDANNWSDANVGSTGCQGVSIEVADIGVGPGMSHEIDITAGVANPMRARPRNGMATDIGSNAIRAHFRIANWGSNLNWVDVPGGEAVTNGTTPIPAGTQGDLTFPWTVVDPLRAEFISGGRARHQCMLVELSGAGLVFVNDSIFRNMDVVGASTFARAAEVGVQGLPPIGGRPERPVYLIVHTTNMPPRVPPKEPPPPPPNDGGVERAEGRPHRDDRLGELFERQTGRPLEDIDDAFRELPTYLVYVFHETGERAVVDGRDLPIVEPGPAFGYVVDHQGPLDGWEHALAGAQLRELKREFWRASVPNDGSVEVRTTIVAREQPLPWWRRLLALLLALLRRLRGWLRRLLKL